MKRVHKRFAAFCITSGLVAVGAIVADPSVYTTGAQLLSGVYLAYLGGQSATDFVKAKNGHAKTPENT